MPTLKANIAGTWTPIGYAPPGRFTATADGVVPLSGGGTVNFLRADGTWGVPSGGALPAGGVLGDILVKQSASAGDATWGTALPKLNLTSTVRPDLTTTAAALIAGAMTDNHIVLGADRIQARSSALAGIPMFLNYFGGDVVIGGGAHAGLTIQARNATGRGLSIINLSPTATSEGGELELVGWSGNPNIQIDNFAGQLRVLMAGAYGSVGLTLSTTGALSVPSAFNFNQYGGGWFMQDSQWMRTSNGKSIFTGAGTVRSQSGFEAEKGGGNLWLWNPNDLDTGVYYWTDNDIGFLTAGGGALRCTSNGVISYRDHYMDAECYSGVNRWFRVRGGGCGLYWQDYDGGWMMNESTTIRAYQNKHINTGGQIYAGTSFQSPGQIRSTKAGGSYYYDQGLYDDPGGTMAGYGWHPGGVAGSLRMQVNADNFHFNNIASDWYYNIIAKSFGVASSQRGKQDLVPLIDVLPALPLHPVATMVRGLHPKWWRTREEYTMREVPSCPDDVEPGDWRPTIDQMPNHVCRTEGVNACGHTPDDPCCWRVNWLRGQLGFVAEEVEQVLPQLVMLDADMKPAALDLGSLVGLAYAMLQELDTRLTAVEAA